MRRIEIPDPPSQSADTDNNIGVECGSRLRCEPLLFVLRAELRLLDLDEGAAEILGV